MLVSCDKSELLINEHGILLVDTDNIASLRSQYGNYPNYFYGGNIGKIGLEASKIGNRSIDAKFEARILSNNVSNKEETIISIGAVNLEHVETNEDGWLAQGFCVENTVTNINSPECKGAVNQVLPYFGASHEFKIEEQGTNILSHTMYVPKRIELENFANTPPDLGSSTYLVDRNDVTLQWNADPNNTNGVFIILMNTELSALEEPGFQYEALHLEDNGFTKIPSSTFHYIPNGGLCEMRVYRGDIHLVTGTNGLEYKVSAISSHEVQLKVE